MKELKVYGGMLFNPNPPPDRPSHKRQERVICAVGTQKELLDILDKAKVGPVSSGYIRNYWSITGNKAEIELALAKPHQLIWTGRT